MKNTLGLDTNNYFNMQGVAQLKNYKEIKSSHVKHEVAQQFESLLVQMLLKSMRDANKLFSSEEESAAGHEVYQDLFDKQISLAIAHQGIGFSNTVEKYLQQTDSSENKSIIDPKDRDVASTNNLKKLNNTPSSSSLESVFETEIEFVKSLWIEAKNAGAQLGIDPKLLLAQAALETGWGKHIIQDNKEGFSYNLFNIKADQQWKKKSISFNSLEEENGVMLKKNSSYRSYPSYAESFNDYVSFIKSNPRYEQALYFSSSPDAYMKKLQEAHYASDTNYSDKVLSIYYGEKFNNLFEKAKLV